MKTLSHLISECKVFLAVSCRWQIQRASGEIGKRTRFVNEHLRGFASSNLVLPRIKNNEFASDNWRFLFCKSILEVKKTTLYLKLVFYIIQTSCFIRLYCSNNCFYFCFILDLNHIIPQTCCQEQYRCVDAFFLLTKYCQYAIIEYC